MTPEQKQALTIEALGLLNEQVQARIVHYKGDLETSPELDAITAQVVAQVKALQGNAVQRPGTRQNPDEVEAAHVRTLGSLLGKVFSGDGHGAFFTQTLKPIGRRVAKLFFESELHERTKADKEKIIHHAEQGVYYVLGRYKNRLRSELEGFEYVDDDIRTSTLETLAKIERDLQVAFLSRRSPELNRVMTVYTSVLTEFLQKHLPPRVEQIAKLTVRAARTAQRPNSVAYKIHSDAFGDFRTEWERLFMQQMINFCEDELMSKLTQGDEQFRDETIRFFTDPHVFAETCQVLCEVLYDQLCMAGFLDLPMDWRVSMAGEA
jgi:hypothetical protein